MNDYTHKVIWITGTSSGIGKETAFRFAEAGARLVLTALEPDLLEQVREECLQRGAEAVTNLPFDLSQTDVLPQLAEEAWNAYGCIDLFYSQAGCAVTLSSNGSPPPCEESCAMIAVRTFMLVERTAPLVLENIPSL